ncbi:unnamed protein product, partial [Staurois parvus]
LKGASRFPDKPPAPADPHNHRPGLWGRGPCPHQHGDKVLWGGSPPAPKHPPMLRACGLVWFRKGGARSSPSPFLTCRAACSDKGLYGFWGEPQAVFLFNFGVELPLNIHTRPEGLGVDGRG